MFGKSASGAKNYTFLPTIDPIRKIVWRQVNYTSREYNIEEHRVEEVMANE